MELTAAAVGDDQVRIGTGTADPALPLRLSNPSLAVFAPKAYGKKGAVNPVGTATGPFALTRITGDTAATLDRFDDYWGGRAQAPGVDATFVADGTARANALRTGQADIAEALPVAQLASLDKGVVRETTTARNTSLYLNTRSGVFADAGLRAAAREAIDTSVIAKDVYERPRRGGTGPLRPRPELGREQAAPAHRTRRSHRPRRAEHHPRHLHRPTRARRDRPGPAAAAGEAGFRVKLEVRDYARLESDLLAGNSTPPSPPAT